MRQKALQIIKHPLIYGSSIVVIGGIISNFFNFLFNLFMSRNLSLPDYGTLASVISLISFPGLMVSALMPLVVSFAGEYFAKGQLEKIRGFYWKVFKFPLFLGLLTLTIFLILTPNLADFFRIENTAVLFFAGIIIFLTFIGILNIALLQAKLAFGFQVFLSLFGSIIKLGAGVIFVLLGFSAIGAVSAITVSSLVTYFLSFIPIRFIFDDKLISSSAINTKELFRYGIPSALTLLGLTSLISTDVLLAKHFFDPKIAGIYAGMSLIGRVIFYISSPISSVMFPIIVRKYNSQENFSNTFKLSLVMVAAPSIVLTALYFLFPEFFVIFFLKKSEYLPMVPYLGLFGVFLSLYCLLFLISNFYLSIKKTYVYIPILIGAVTQIILVTLFHQSFFQLIQISILVTFLLVLGLLLYYPHASQKRL